LKNVYSTPLLNASKFLRAQNKKRARKGVRFVSIFLDFLRRKNAEISARATSS